MNIKKRDHHYVFQAYLKHWTNEKDNKLWCLREKDIFPVTPRNIAFEKDLYRVLPLNNKEIEFIKLFFSKHGSAFNKGVDDFLTLYTSLDTYEKVFIGLRSLFPNDCPEAEEAMDDINNMLDIARNNLTEDTFAEFEGEATTWLNILCEENISYFHSSNDERERLINFICMQYFRTVKIRNNILLVLKQAEKIFINDQFPKGCLRAENLVFPMLWIISARCADALLKAPLSIIINKTSTAFITSDQPVINIKADYNDLSSEPSDLVLYYPISPLVAVLINDHNGEIRVELNSERDVEQYNDLIKKACNKMIFSDSLAVLEKYKNS